MALRPGSFVPYHACFSFVCDLGAVKGQIQALTRIQASRAVDLCETFLAGCHEKANEIDDSGGSFGQFVQDLCCDWIKARQANEADPAETASKLLAWMDDDPWGFCYDLDRHAVKVLNKPGLAAFEKAISRRFETAMTTKRTTPESRSSSTEYAGRRWGGALRAVYEAQRNVRAYVELAERTRLTAADCHVVARLLMGRGKTPEALSWVERGLQIERASPHESMAGCDLRQLKRALLSKLGRRREALDAAWRDFQEHPSTYSYNDLMMHVPRGERSQWHERAIEAAKGGDDLATLLELLVATREVTQLADVVRERDHAALAEITHYVTEPAAMRLTKRHPDAAARLWCALGSRIANAKKSKYYDIAIAHFARARQCYVRAGLGAAWEQVVRQIRADHCRKVGFISDFERVAKGSGPRREPPFLERAKTKWRQRQRAGVP